MLIVDWFMWQLPLERKILESEKNMLRDKLTTLIEDDELSIYVYKT